MRSARGVIRVRVVVGSAISWGMFASLPGTPQPNLAGGARSCVDTVADRVGIPPIPECHGGGSAEPQPQHHPLTAGKLPTPPSPESNWLRIDPTAITRLASPASVATKSHWLAAGQPSCTSEPSGEKTGRW